MQIENECHSHPWSEKTFRSCIGGRYFGEKISESLNPPDNIVGFYIGERVIDEATLMDICVKPINQGKGLGKKLLIQFIKQAKAQGAVKIWLEVRAKNITAQMLYMNAGFIETGRRTGYYPSTSGFGYEDAIVMCLS
ncbi:MAG: ribosomal protein S18-alanine N-acetyltransferase [Colwellia sp.]|nr:ribosomal protein S18-alanine N-acetyltransferase [Colwellia sp.]